VEVGAKEHLLKVVVGVKKHPHRAEVGVNEQLNS